MKDGVLFLFMEWCYWSGLLQLQMCSNCFLFTEFKWG